MDLDELANKEDQLYNTVRRLLEKRQTKEVDDELFEVFVAYNLIHRQYADFAKDNIEALKRGLFIQWYALVEPNYLSGISDLDEQAELKVIDALNEKILNKTLDDELNWMISYYLHWDWVFDRFNEYKGLDKIKGKTEDGLPNRIDKEKMNQRGQMGKYWNSLKIFK
jgi:hypothetical protein